MFKKFRVTFIAPGPDGVLDLFVFILQSTHAELAQKAALKRAGKTINNVVGEIIIVEIQENN